MKKIYNNPQIRIVQVKTAKMIAASIEMYGRNATGTAMGRHQNNWDEDEEDYE